jgi:phage terminase large subunit
MAAITLPNDWEARDYQCDLTNYMMSGGTMEKKRAVDVWHRRAGKDSTSLNLAAVGTQMRVGTYWHMLPSLQQARRVVWDGIDKQGRRMIDQVFPKELRSGINNSEMKISFKNGSIWQCVGSDNYDTLVGTNPIGVVFSEYSIADPMAWDYIRPILLENDGWAIFIYTPRGKTHGFTLWDTNKDNPKWHTSVLTIDDTKILTAEQVEEEIRAGMSREKALQEFYCSWDVGMEGAFYTEEIAWSESNNHIGNYPWKPDKEVYTYWDIGIRDHTSVIFVQDFDGTPCIIDHHRERNKGLPYWAKYIKDKPYVYGTPHKGPHDIETHDWSTGRIRSEVAATEYGIEFEAVDKISVAEGIDAARAMLRNCLFNESTTDNLRISLANYHRLYDAKRMIFKDNPDHDWSSDDADCFRYFSVDWQSPRRGNILIQDERGNYVPNIQVNRAHGGKRRRRA